MSGRYERVTGQDDDDVPPTPIATQPRVAALSAMPDSPPPSFRSRASSLASRERRNRVEDPTLADAFDADGDDSGDDEPDDRQRLVHSNSFPINDFGTSETDRPALPERQVTQLPRTAATADGARVVGGGNMADGVFSNLSAKPERGAAEKDEQPPTYEQAAADAAPPYWETTILAPGLGGPDDVFIDGMPVGSVFSFAWNGMITVSFSLVGFLLTYLLHSTHAAKNGSRAGLGVILIQYGFALKGASGDMGSGGAVDPSTGMSEGGLANPPDPNSHDFDPNDVSGGSAGGLDGFGSADWVGYLLMIVGWFILIRSISDYLKARRHEQLVLQSPDRGLPVPIIAEGESSETVV